MHFSFCIFDLLNFIMLQYLCSWRATCKSSFTQDSVFDMAAIPQLLQSLRCRIMTKVVPL